MKRALCLIALCAAIVSPLAGQEPMNYQQDYDQVPPQAYVPPQAFQQPVVRPAYPREINPPWAFFRGCVNLATCWLELPRNIVNENAEFPVFGIGSGLLKGTFFMTSRLILGVVDVSMFGFTGPSAFSPDEFPEFVFSSRWAPYAPPTPYEESLQVEFEELDAVEENMETSY